MIETIEFLKDRLKGNLPGNTAQKTMAPMQINDVSRDPKQGSEPRQSAVLVLMLPGQKEEWDVLYTLRSRNLNYHGGQVCFPGGRMELNETPEEAAIREAYEEVGITPEDVNVIGQLSPLYAAPSNNLITPIVASIDYRPHFKLREEEVEDVFTLGLRELMDESNIRKETWKIMDYELDVPFWDLYNVPLWGATAMVSAEFVTIMKEYFE